MAVLPPIRKASLEDQARTDATKAENAARSRLPVAAAPVAAAPVTAPRASPYDNFGAAGVSATAPAAAAPRLPVDFKTAGFSSAAEQSAASGVPMKPLADNTTPRTRLPDGTLPPTDAKAAAALAADSSMAGFVARASAADAATREAAAHRVFMDKQGTAQAAANASAAQARANTPVPMSRETGYALGNAIRAENIAAAEKAALRPAQNPAMAGAQARAAAGQLNLAGRIGAQQDAATAYQKQNPPMTREENLAKSIREGTFESIRDKYNETNKATHSMDATGKIHELPESTRQKIITSTASVKRAETKAADDQAKAIFKFHSSKLKDLLGVESAAEALKKKQPASVGANIAGIFGVTPKPFMMGGLVKPTAPAANIPAPPPAVQQPSASRLPMVANEIQNISVLMGDPNLSFADKKALHKQALDLAALRDAEEARTAQDIVTTRQASVQKRASQAEGRQKLNLLAAGR